MKKAEIHVRQATVEDADAITRLSRTVQQLHVDAYPQYFVGLEETESERRDYFQFYLEYDAYVVLIAEIENQPVGYLVGAIKRNSRSPFVDFPRTLMIEQISVDQEFQGTGVGKKLIKVSSEFAKNRNILEIKLKVWQFNESAIGFYEQLGYEVVAHDMILKLNDKI